MTSVSWEALVAQGPRSLHQVVVAATMPRFLGTFCLTMGSGVADRVKRGQKTLSWPLPAWHSHPRSSEPTCRDLLSRCGVHPSSPAGGES